MILIISSYKLVTVCLYSLFTKIASRDKYFWALKTKLLLLQVFFTIARCEKSMTKFALL